jgi:hypothetical protein
LPWRTTGTLPEVSADDHPLASERPSLPTQRAVQGAESVLVRDGRLVNQDQVCKQYDLHHHRRLSLARLQLFVYYRPGLSPGS